MARGRYPLATAQYNIIPSIYLDASKGKYVWANTPTPIGSFDPAFEAGGDMPIFTAGLYGKASAWINLSNVEEKFKTDRWVVQVEQQFPIEKGDYFGMGDSVIKACKGLGIRPEWFITDRSGNATGLYHYLRMTFGQIMGQQWGEAATEKKILDEDTETAHDQFPNVISEMWFAYSIWLELGYLKHAPLLQTGPMHGKKLGLFGQLEARKYDRVRKTMRRAQSKDDYKAENGGESPDEADSAIQLVHLVRQRAETSILVAPNATKAIPRTRWQQTSSPVDKVEFIDVI